MGKKVLHIAKVTGIHGTEKHLLSLLPELNRNHEIIFIILTEHGSPVSDYFDLLKKQGIKAYNIIIRFDIDLFCFCKLFFLIKKLKPWLVHTHLIHGDIYGIAAAWLAGTERIVSTKHNDDSFRRNMLLRSVNSFLNRRADRIIAISKWVCSFVCEVEGVPTGKVKTIHYGLGQSETASHGKPFREEMGFSGSEIVLGIIARLVEQKGHCYLIEAFAKAFEKNRHIRLLIVGEGELKKPLENLVQKKHLEGVIIFTGYRNNINDILGALDIFVHPSLWEGFGLAILEAMAMGKPVVATNISAIPELVEAGVTGLLVPPKDINSLADAVVRLSQDEGMRKKLGQNARQRSRKLFSFEIMVEKTEKLYDELM